MEYRVEQIDLFASKIFFHLVSGDTVLQVLFALLSTHSLGAFVFTTLGAIVGATIGLLRLLGLVRQ